MAEVQFQKRSFAKGNSIDSWMQGLVIPKITGFTIEMRQLIRALLITGMLITSVSCSAASVSPTHFPQALLSTPAVVRITSTSTITIPTITVEEVTPSNTTTMTLTAIETEQERITPMPEPEILKITIIYDNNMYDTRLKTAWGFSALVEYHDHTLLFDTGGDGPTLMSNMRILGIDPTGINSVVLSHIHGDHVGGLVDLLESGARPVVYLLPSFPDVFKNQVSQKAEVIEVTRGMQIFDDIYTTGEMGESIHEQSLVIVTAQGLVIVTGCAHPGIVKIVDQVQDMFTDPVNLVMGGFHLGSKNEPEIESILRDFRRLGVQHVAPCHCTGDRATAMFASEYGVDFIQAGAGRVYTWK